MDAPGSLPHQYPIEVSARHLDELGHVNNARYFEFFELGRTTWYDDGGFTAARHDAGITNGDTVVANINCDFLRECRRGERLPFQPGQSVLVRRASPYSRACSKRTKTFPLRQ